METRNYMDGLYKHLKMTNQVDSFLLELFITPCAHKHNWALSREEFHLSINLNEKNENIVKCKSCKLSAKRIRKDNYTPAVYEYFVESNEDNSMSCEERCIKNII